MASGKQFFCHSKRPCLKHFVMEIFAVSVFVISHKAEQWMLEIHLFCKKPVTSKPLHFQDQSNQQISGHKFHIFGIRYVSILEHTVA
jgi:hypothetical protein